LRTDFAFELVQARGEIITVTAMLAPCSVNAKGA